MLDFTSPGKIKYVVDQDGKKAAVQVEISLWTALLSHLEDRELVKQKLARLRKGPDESQAIPWQDAGQEW